MIDSDRFDKFFKLISYSVILCGLFSLLVSESIGIVLSLSFLTIIIVAWFLEKSKWQLTERIGTGLIVLLIPFFVLDWKYGLSGFTTSEGFAAGNLSRSILILAAVKLLQKKSYRDWIFLYIVTFFEILLAAGLSISPLFIVSLSVYLIFATCAILTFEIKKTSESVRQTALTEKSAGKNKTYIWRLPILSAVFLLITAVFAVPLFFALPRTGNAGFGKGLDKLSVTGFSDSVRLGEIASVQQNNEIVMRVRIAGDDQIKLKQQIRWRGVALDTFDNISWSKSVRAIEPYFRNEQDFFQVDYARTAEGLVEQTFYVEPLTLETPILFSLARPVAVRGNFAALNRDADGAISASRNMSDRTIYKVYSDASQPDAEKLRADNTAYQEPSRRYLTLPQIDNRISELAQKIVSQANARNRYDKAQAIESYLKTNYGYTLDLKASGEQPLADFLFNVREGHCEYFATALAVMLRSQGVATRIVNGFQAGEYNATADVYVVRQREAHSWVEVYFPKDNVWVPFDATPASGQFSSDGAAGIIGNLSRYAEALETYWIQYVVAYDDQEQKSLMRSVRNNLQDLQANLIAGASSLEKRLSNWWRQVRGDEGLIESAWAIAGAILYLLGFLLGIVFLIWLYRKIVRLEIWKRLIFWLKNKRETSIIDFYERMQKVLASKGLTRESHQTPLEFAFALDMPEAVSITEKYNRVRFGEKNLSRDETQEIENWLKDLAENKGK